MNRISTVCLSLIALQLAGGAVSLCAQQDSGTEAGAPLTQSKKGRAPAQKSSAEGITTVPEDFANARLSPGVLLRFGVFDAPEMDATLRVTSDGNVAVPLAGPVQIGGLSITEARAKIREALIGGEFFKDPQVTIDIVQLAPGYITLLGEVQTPGRFQILSPISLQEALVLAGGETVEAGAEIDIQRSAVDSGVEHILNDKESSRNDLRKIMVSPGDAVTVQRAGVVYILGSVHRPGGYLMLNKGSLNLLEALSLAGGTSLEASTDSIRILHRHDQNVVEEKISLSHLTSGNSPAPSLGDKDIVYVPSSKAKSIFVNGAVIIGAAASAVLYRVP